jgi:hypothetical protein
MRLASPSEETVAVKPVLRYTLAPLFAWIVAAAGSPLSGHAVRSVDAAEPIAVLSVASLDRLMSDVAYLAEVAGRPELAGWAEGAGVLFFHHFDRTRPAGVLITLGADDQPKGVGFLPIPDVSKLLRLAQDRFGIEVDDLGGGVKKVEIGKGAYVRQQGPWLFFSDHPRHLAQLPDDPQALLQGLDSEYDVALRLHVRNVPRRIRDVIDFQLQTQIDTGFQSAAWRDSGTDAELVASLHSGLKHAVSAVINQFDQLTIGWAVDSGERRTILDLHVQGAEGSALARSLSEFSGRRAGNARFALQDAAATFHGSTQVSPGNARWLQAVVEYLREQTNREIDRDPSAPQALKPIIAKVLDVVNRTLDEGEADLGAAIVLGPKSFSFAGGIRVADGEVLAEAIQQLFELARHEPNVPPVEFYAQKHQDVDFHQFSVPVAERDHDARKILGDTLDVVIGTQTQYLYLAFGNAGDALLKQIIDRAQDGQDHAVGPLSVHLAMKPLLEFLASLDSENPEIRTLVQAARQARAGTDISLNITPVPHGLGCRLELQEGVLEILAKVSQDTNRP